MSCAQLAAIVEQSKKLQLLVDLAAQDESKVARHDKVVPVKAVDAKFPPAGTEAQVDVRVLCPIALYGDFGKDGRHTWGISAELVVGVVGEALTLTFVRKGDGGHDVQEKEELSKETVGTVLEFNSEGAARIAFREPVPKKSASKGGGFRSNAATTATGFGAFGAHTGGGFSTAKHVATGGFCGAGSGGGWETDGLLGFRV